MNSGGQDSRSAAWDKVEAAILRRVMVKREPMDQAVDHVTHQLRKHVPRGFVQEVADSLRNDMDRNRVVENVVADVNAYEGSQPCPTALMSGERWQQYRALLESGGALGLDELGRTTMDVCSLLVAPSEIGTRRKGLVMGNVQSGKTRHFAGLIARAVDMGYRFVIVLSGLHNNLREQTQSRLDRDLFTDEEFWHHLTRVDNNDFDRGNEMVSLMGRNSRLRLCAVVKKNKTRLRNLEVSLRGVPEEIREKCPILIVDDEADQATPNSEQARERISAINAALRKIWALVPSGSYVAYTATPFANVLMDPDDEEDLFPSDFVYTLDPGDGYLGAEQVFGLADPDVDNPDPQSEGLDIVRIIPLGDSELLRPPSRKAQREGFDPEPPNSLVDAVKWFVVASAVRRARGHRGHSSMLVHTTHYTDPHFAMQGRLRVVVDGMRRDVEQHHGEGLSPFYESWKKEYKRIEVPEGQADPSWGAVAEQVPQVLSDMEVIVDNGQSEDRLNYDDNPRTVIAVGGGTLSRGLTLEGLVVSYFTRTSNTYDTLMQMGRWFGYRPGYEDLPRIWVADGLDRDYAFLALVEKDLRDEIRSLEGGEFTPRQVGVKVRSHPGRLEITAAGKMTNARVVQVSMSGVRQQTFIMDGSPRLTHENLRALEKLLGDHELRLLTEGGHRWIARGLTTQEVIDFLRGYRFHQDQKVFADPDLLGSAIEWLDRFARSSGWNVVLAGNSTRGAGESLGELHVAGVSIPMLRRAPLRGSTVEKLDFKAIMSPADRLADIDPGVYKDLPHSTDPERMAIRRRLAGGDGLIVVYPISHLTAKDQKLGTRVDMPPGVGEDLFGFGIVYPNVADDTEQGSFVSVRPSSDVDLGEPEEDDEWRDEE
ncbi:Z1 domain [Propionibacterium australiense]|nr:Z1 domain [Propionibacterium australiense]